MKAFILAAGNGSRLRPLTDYTPKCLLPVCGTPLLEIWLQNCSRAGVTEVLVNVHAHADQLREFVQTQHSGVRVQLAEEDVLLGSAGTLAAKRQFVKGEREFFVLYGDVLTNTDLRELVQAHRNGGAIATLGAYEVPDPARCGVMSLNDDGIIESFIEKPEHPASNLAFAGLMVAGHELFDFIPEEQPSDIGFHVLPKLVGRMRAVKLENYLLDIGTMENYCTAQTCWPGLPAPEKERVAKAI